MRRRTNTGKASGDEVIDEREVVVATSRRLLFARHASQTYLGQIKLSFLSLAHVIFSNLSCDAAPTPCEGSRERSSSHSVHKTSPCLLQSDLMVLKTDG